MTDQRPPLHKVGVMWKPKPNSKSHGNGSLTVNGLKQRFIVLANDKKTKDTDPDFHLMSSDEPEVDRYARSSDRRASEAVN